MRLRSIKQIVAEKLSRHGFLPLRLSEYFFQVREVGSEKEKEIFRRIWKQVWLGEGYASTQNLPEIEQHYARFDPYSRDCLLMFRIPPVWWLPIGTFRVIRDEIGTPVLEDFQISVSMELRGRRVEATLFALLPRWRGLLFPWFFLLRGVYQVATKKEGADLILMAADWRLWEKLKKIFSESLIQLGPSKFYEGSETFPGVLNVKKAEEEIRKRAPALFVFFTSKY